ncbi:MAG: tetratricopeptide repeat protein [Candidatus Eremiobacterota bacterium]
MDCNRFIKKIHNSTEEDKNTEIISHLNKCPSCKEEYRLFENSLEALKGVEIIIAPADKMWGEISRKISEKRRKPSFYIPQAIVIPACIILIIFAGILLRNIKKEYGEKSEINEIYRLMSDNNYTASLEKARTLINSRSSSKNLPELMFIEGKCNEKLGNEKEAEKIYKEVAEKFPRTNFAAEVFYMKGLDYEKSANLSEAAKNYSYIIDNYVYEKLWFFEDMALRLKTCETIMAEEEMLFTMRGDNKKDQSHQENLKKISDIIEKSFPEKKEEIEIKEAELFIEKEEFQKSLEIAENLIKNGDDHIRIKGMLIKGKSLYGQGNCSEAKKEFEKIISDYPSSDENQKNNALYYLNKINNLKDE